MSLKNKCSRPECNFIKHPDIENNSGTHCCSMCKINNGHGIHCTSKIIKPADTKPADTKPTDTKPANSSIPYSVRNFFTNDVCLYTYTIPGRKLDTISNIYIITLAETYERHAYIRNLMKAHNIECTICVMNKPTDKVYQEYISWALKKNIKPIFIGELGCTASHYWVLKNEIKEHNSTDKIIIMEDDICFQDDMYTKMNIFLNKEEIYNQPFVLLSSNDWNKMDRIFNPDNLLNGYYCIQKSEEQIYGNTCFCIDTRYINNIIDLFINKIIIADHFSSYIFDTIYVAEPPLCLPDRTTSSINHIYEKGSEKYNEYNNKCNYNINLDNYEYIVMSDIIGQIQQIKNDIHAEECLSSGTWCDECIYKYNSLFSILYTLKWDDIHKKQFIKELIVGFPEAPIFDRPILNPVSMDTAICIAYFNPCKFKRSKLNLETICSHFSRFNIPVFIGQLFYYDNGSIYLDLPHNIHIFNFHSNSVMFHKENIWNQIEKKVPSQYTKLIFLDGDIFINEPLQWYETIQQKLEYNDVVQPFSLLTYYDINYKSIYNLLCIIQAKKNREHTEIFQDINKYMMYSTFGFGFACRRDWFNNVDGFIEYSIMGGGDLLTFGSILNISFDTSLTFIKQLYMHKFLEEFQSKITNTRYDCVPYNVFHLFHGELNNRQYNSRFSLIEKLKLEDLYKNKEGIIEFKSPNTWNPIFLKYFQGRREDD